MEMVQLLALFLVLLGSACSSRELPSRDELNSLLNEAEDLFRNQVEDSHVRYRKRVHPYVKEFGPQAAAFSYASETLAREYNISKEEADHHLLTRTNPRPEFNANAMCGRTFTCNPPWPYRTPDGVCNNLNRPGDGMAVSRFLRLLSPVYGDGVSSFRRSKLDGSPLLSPRIISLLIHPDNSFQHPQVTHMVVFFGQFLDHDITSTPEFDGSTCCNNPTNPSPTCMPIAVPNNDPFYAQFQIGCIQIGRSIPACGGGVREQINQASAYLDGSQIYGNSQLEQNNLRDGSNAFLAVDMSSGFQMLPLNNSATTCFNNSPTRVSCMVAGDDRVNENPGLGSMHTIWLREHNRIAGILGTQNAFEEARRLTIAEYQNIIYSEFLPTILGPNAMNQWGLNLPAAGSFSTYNPNIPVGIFNSFATAAYRFGHTLIQGIFSLSNGNTLPLESNFQNPSIFFNDPLNAERLLFGASQQNAQNYDNFLTSAVTNHLFQNNGQFGSDLASLNIQRGRDHGLPTYNDFRRACGLPVANSFSDLVNFFGSQDKANRFSDSYRTVNDIDLWPAGISEVPVSGGVVGPTFACIIGQQFQRLKDGDRFFFTHSGQTGSFTSAQLSMIRKRSLSSVICDNNKLGNSAIRQNAFLTSSSSIACSSTPKLTLTNWVQAAGK